MWRDAELALGAVVHNYVNILNPDTMVLGGGIVEGLPYLRDFARDYLDRRAVRPAAQEVERGEDHLRVEPPPVHAHDAADRAAGGAVVFAFGHTSFVFE
jgi:predicted NBD/HSP70 family sugar kinase